MKKTFLVLLLFVIPNLLISQSKSDSAKIKITVLNYIEGWYEGDVNRMKKALHPLLAKRMVYTDSKTGKSKLRDLTTSQMLEYTKAGGAKYISKNKRAIEYFILDMLKNTASVKVSSIKFTDYLHLIKWNGEWVIINVVWENKQQKK